MINVAGSRAIQRFILVTSYDMLPSRHIQDLVGYIRYHNPAKMSWIARWPPCSTCSTARIRSDCDCDRSPPG